MTPERILVKGANWLGDAVMSLPLLAELARRFPAARVVVLTRPSLADLYALAPGAPATISQGADLNPTRAPRAWWRLVRELRAARFDLALVLPGSFLSALTVRAGGVARRIGYAQEARSFLLTDALPRRPELARRHRVESYLHLLSALGETPAPTAPALRLTAEHHARASEVLAAAGIAADATCVGLNPGATYGSAKQWPADRYQEAGRTLARDGARVLVFGGPDEAALGARVAGAIPGAVDLSGRTPLPLLAALLARCAVLVTNDTGPMHVAQAVGAPIVAIFGPTDPETTPPYGDRWTLVRKPVDCSPCLLRTCPIDHRCMLRIDVAEVVAAARAELGRSGRPADLAAAPTSSAPASAPPPPAGATPGATPAHR